MMNSNYTAFLRGTNGDNFANNTEYVFNDIYALYLVNITNTTNTVTHDSKMHNVLLFVAFFVFGVILLLCICCQKRDRIR